MKEMVCVTTQCEVFVQEKNTERDRCAHRNRTDGVKETVCVTTQCEVLIQEKEGERLSVSHNSVTSVYKIVVGTLTSSRYIE